MKISEIKFDFIPPLLRSNKRPIGDDDLLYIRQRSDKVNVYTVLKLRSIRRPNGYKEYILADESGNVCTADREMICLYIGQNLKLQRVYDIITQTISPLFLSALYGLIKLFPELWEFLLG